MTSLRATPLLLLALSASFANAEPRINELHYDNAGTDAGEAIELVATRELDLNGWSLALYNGSNGARYNTVALTGSWTLDAACNEYFQVVNLPVNGLQNGSPDGIALVDNLGTVLEFLSYEGTFTATDGPAAGLLSIDMGVAEASDTPLGFSLQHATNNTWLAPAAATFGTCNGVTHEPGPDPEPAVVSLISTIQGSGAAVTTTSPVTVRALVTATYLGASAQNGFYLQEEPEDSDNNADTSEAIFVFCPLCTNISRGDRVEVTGTPGELFGLSQLSALRVTLIDRANPLPAPTVLSLPLPLASTDPLEASASIQSHYEALEGMLVTIDTPLTVTELFNLGRFGEILLSAPERLRQFTDAHAPDAAGFAWHQATRPAFAIILDDGASQQNPEPVAYPVGGLSANEFVRAGDQLLNLTGVLSYGFSNWRIQPVFEAYSYDFIAANPRPSALAPASGPRVASFNVLNYFTTLDQGAPLCGPTGGLDCRGASSAEELARQQAKLTAALCELNADVLGLMEIENNGSTLVALAERLSAQCGPHLAVATGTIGSDAITTGLIYRPGKVAPTGATAVLATPEFLNPNQSAVNKNRPAVAQSFIDSATGTAFTVVVNHLKSKGSACTDGIDPFDDDTLTGQGNCNGTRTRAAAAQVAWLAGQPTGVTTEHVLVIGDLNAYRNEDPVSAFKAAGFTDLVDDFGGPAAYSYVFRGEWGYLDHALASASLVPFVSQVMAWHINADETPLFDYNSEFKPANYLSAIYEPTAYRTSDHDPLVVDLAFPAAVLTLPMIVAAFEQAVAAGDLTGSGRWPLLQWLNLNLFGTLLGEATRLQADAHPVASCALVALARRKADSEKAPADLVQGPAKAALNGQLSTYLAANCGR